MKILLALMLLFNIQTATLYETHDNVACFATNDGNLWECHVDAPETLEVGEYKLIFINDRLINFQKEG